MIAAFIAGMGWITPLGRGLSSVWKDLGENKCADSVLLESPISDRAMPVLRVPVGLMQDVVALPRLRRSSVISHLAVAAAVDAVASAKLSAEALKRTALIFAASDGGVVYTRKFYAEIVERGEGSGSPLLFPETVYNAPASHIAARLGLQGEVLTLVGDAVVGFSAVQAGCELLSSGEVDYVLIAAAQELDWITCEAYGRWGLIQNTRNDAFLFSEGAAAIVLARETGKCHVAPHLGHPCSAKDRAPRNLDAMLEGLLPGSPVNLVVSSASGIRLQVTEQRYVAKHLPMATILTPKSVLGESLACSTIQQIIVGALALKEFGDGSALVTAIGYDRELAGLILTHRATRG